MKLLQAYLARWSGLVFVGHEKKLTRKVRALRLLEEAIELAQAELVTVEEVGVIISQVYAKPPGHPVQELGGVLTTAGAYANTVGVDMEDVAWLEALRIMDPEVMNKVRNRNLGGDKIGIEV